MNRAEGKAYRGRNRRDDRHRRQPVEDIVLKDQRGSRFANFPAYRRIERREVDFAAPRLDSSNFFHSS